MSQLTCVSVEETQRVLRQLDAPYARTRAFADIGRLNALYMIMHAGSGHIGSSFSCMDIVSWLHLNEMRRPGDGDPDGDVYFSSKGHDAPALYAVLIGLGLLDAQLLHQFRRNGGLPGHPDIGTPHVPTNTGSLGMGISKAKGMIHANRLTGRHQRLYVLTGDGELQEGQVWESLASAANHRLAELTVIVDHNTIQSDTWVRDVSDLGDLEAKFSSFGWRTLRCDGHNLPALERALAAARDDSDRPSVIIADTIKGGGAAATAHTSMAPGEWRYLFHSGAPTVEVYNAAADELLARVNATLLANGVDALRTEHRELPSRPAVEGAQRLIPAYTRALVACAEQDPSIVALDGDLILDTGLIPFRDRFPERFFECGIAEQDMVSQAGGMALRGLRPFVHSFSCFLHARPNEQIYNNATERTRIVYVGSLAGLIPGTPGHSHQSVRDISALAAVPGLIMLEPSCEQEVAEAVRFCATTDRGSCYLRLVSVPWPINFELPANARLEFGRGTVVAEGDDAALVSYGPIMLSQAIEARSLLQAEGIHLRVVNLPWLNVVDDDWLRQTVGALPHVFTLDNHYLTGGQGDLIAKHLAAVPERPPLTRFGLADVPEGGTPDEVLRAHHLDAESLARQVRAALAATRSPAAASRGGR